MFVCYFTPRMILLNKVILTCLWPSCQNTFHPSSHSPSLVYISYSDINSNRSSILYNTYLILSSSLIPHPFFMISFLFCHHLSSFIASVIYIHNSIITSHPSLLFVSFLFVILSSFPLISRPCVFFSIIICNQFIQFYCHLFHPSSVAFRHIFCHPLHLSSCFLFN